MKVQYTLPLALASLAAAQDSEGTSLADALASKNDTLSTLNGTLAISIGHIRSP